MDELEMEVATVLADALKGHFEDEDADEDEEPLVSILDVQVDFEEGHATLDWALNAGDDEEDDDEEGDEDE